jgi:hypothetical protein
MLYFTNYRNRMFCKLHLIKRENWGAHADFSKLYITSLLQKEFAVSEIPE